MILSISTLLVGLQIGAATMENNMEFPHKINDKTTTWPINSTSAYLSKEIQNTNLKSYMHPYDHWSVIYNSQDIEAA